MTPPSRQFAYVGCRTTRERNAEGRGLTVFELGDRHEWRQIQLVEGLRNPSYLCAHPTQAVMYAVHGDLSEISTFDIARDGSLERVGEQSTHGMNPVHLAISPSLRWLLVANYASGNVASMKIGDDGKLGAVSHTLKLLGNRGPHPQQDGAHPHQVCFSADGHFVFVPDKGLDAVFTLRLNEDTGALQVIACCDMERGSGPRHMAFHPNLPLAYVVGELNRTIVTVRRDDETGRLHPVAERATVPFDVTVGSAAGVVLARDASFLYVSNRGHDSVAVFPVGHDGLLGSPFWLPAGRTPRFICEPPAGGPLLVAREDDHSVAVLERAANAFIDVAQTGSPVCVVFRKVNQ